MSARATPLPGQADEAAVKSQCEETLSQLLKHKQTLLLTNVTFIALNRYNSVTFHCALAAEIPAQQINSF